MNVLLPVLIALGFAQPFPGQPQSFDAATFVAPPGWTRSEASGVLAFEDTTTGAPRNASCQLILFTSRPAGANPNDDFQIEWNEHVTKLFGAVWHTPPQVTQRADGWTMVNSVGTVLRQRTQTNALLFTAIGAGRVMSILVLVSDGTHQAAIQGFLTSLRFAGASTPLTPRPSQSVGDFLRASPTTGGSVGNIVFAPPEGWSQQQTPQGIMLVSPVYNTGERCQISVPPMGPASGDVVAETLNAFRQLYRVEPLAMAYPTPKMTRGTSPSGWEYAVVKRTIGTAGGSEMGVTLMGVNAGSQFALISGLSKEFLVSSCFGETIRDVWPAFFASIQFRNAALKPLDASQIRQGLAGTWTTATASVGLQYTFTANGRYADAGAVQHRNPISPTEVVSTTQAYFGNGAYTVDGNTMTLVGDDNRRSAFLFRLEQESRDGQSWIPRLCLLAPGSTGEVCYQRDR